MNFSFKIHTPHGKIPFFHKKIEIPERESKKNQLGSPNTEKQKENRNIDVDKL